MDQHLQAMIDNHGVPQDRSDRRNWPPPNAVSRISHETSLNSEDIHGFAAYVLMLYSNDLMRSINFYHIVGIGPFKTTLEADFFPSEISYNAQDPAVSSILHLIRGLLPVVSMIQISLQPSQPGGVSKETIDRLPCTIVNQEFIDSKEKECSICLEEVQVNQEVRTPRCGHWFHSPCIVSWLEKGEICPTCRTPVADAPVPNNYHLHASLSVSSSRGSSA